MDQQKVGPNHYMQATHLLLILIDIGSYGIITGIWAKINIPFSLIIHIMFIILANIFRNPLMLFIHVAAAISPFSARF